jgi:hypothetical protein
MQPQILLTWELGGGWGHLATLRPLASAFAFRGHTLTAALRDASNAHDVFKGLDIVTRPVPSVEHVPRQLLRPSASFADILAAEGYLDFHSLCDRVRAWVQMINVTQPLWMISDYSPTALIAARATRTRAIVVGTGFYSPPDITPLPLFRPVPANVAADAQAMETRVLSSVNEVLQRYNAKPLDRLSQLVHDVELNALTTFHELDHYRTRAEATYWGPLEQLDGDVPSWPNSCDVPRVFVYLKRFRHLTQTLGTLSKRPFQFLICLPDVKTLPDELIQTTNMRFVHRPLRMDLIGESCDAAICHGGHGATASLLLAGKPILFLPLWQEQQLIAENVIRLRAGLGASIRLPQMIAARLVQLLTDTSFTTAARRFSAKYATFSPSRSIDRLMTHIDASE